MTISLALDHTKPAPRKRASRKSRARLNVVADFETTTYIDENGRTRVWGWGVTTTLDPYGDFDWGTSIESFIQWISDANTLCHFHNLKFDGQFLVDWLLNNGYEFTPDIASRERGSFTALRSAMGMMYSITVFWKNGKVTEFRDSLKKIPMPVARIAKAWNFEEGKGEIDYDTIRPFGYEPTPEEIDYIRRDVVIVATALAETISEGMHRLTVASDALSEYKDLIGPVTFSKLFPILDPDMDAEIRRAYRGGFTYADERFKGRETCGGVVLDVNSLYPYVMASQLLPYGEPIFVEGQVVPTESHPLAIYSVTFTAKLKPNHIPCIQIKGSSRFGATQYLREIDEPTTLMVTHVDMALYEAHYDIDVIEYGGGWLFKATVGLFDKYIDKWSKIKEAATGGRREIAKLHLNSLYGKFASNPNITGMVPVLVDGIVKWVIGEPETREPVYTAMGVFITSYARDLTIRAAQENYDVFAYADTDSLHLLRSDVPESIDVHPTRMGAWKFEYAFDTAFYVRAKAYVERHPPTHHPKCKPWCFETHYTNAIAGLPVRITSKLTFADLVHDKILRGKLTPESVPGGVILRDIDFKLKLH